VPRNEVNLWLYSFFNLDAKCTLVINDTLSTFYPWEIDSFPILNEVGRSECLVGLVHKFSSPPDLDASIIQYIHIQK